MNTVSLPFPWSDLLTWYDEYGRHDLEWRDYVMEDDLRIYRIWLSEIFLQQTQVERVRGYFRNIIEKYPTVHDLAGASYDEFFPYYQGMGYYSRARNLLSTAKIISEDYKGVFPREKSLLEKLPGVGGYTSSAILAFGYGEAYLAWDTNLEKVFARYYHGSRLEKLSEGEKGKIEDDFRGFVRKEKEQIRSINNALMDFASVMDLKNPANIDWENYPIKSGKFYHTRGKDEPTEVKKSVSFLTPDATVMVVLHQDHKVYYAPVISSEGDSRSREILLDKKQDISIGGYHPFVLAPSLSRDTRRYVQEYFREKYSLELSVRPAHKKWISGDGRPYIVVNAQIQTGNHDFREYTKSEAKKLLESL